MVTYGWSVSVQILWLTLVVLVSLDGRACSVSCPLPSDATEWDLNPKEIYIVWGYGNKVGDTSSLYITLKDMFLLRYLDN